MGQSEGGGDSNQEDGKDSVREGWADCDNLRLAGSLGTLEPSVTQVHTVSWAVLSPSLRLLPAHGNPEILLGKRRGFHFFLEPGEEVS